MDIHGSSRQLLLSPLTWLCAQVTAEPKVWLCQPSLVLSEKRRAICGMHVQTHVLIKNDILTANNFGKFGKTQKRDYVIPNFTSSEQLSGSVLTFRSLLRLKTGDGRQPSGELHSISRKAVSFQMTQIHHPWTQGQLLSRVPSTVGECVLHPFMTCW